MRTFIVPIIAAAFFVGGCGGTDSDNGSGSTTRDSSEIDGCEVVTQADASKLFGQTATKDPGFSVPGMLGHCNWTWDTETSNQLLQFSVWTREAYAKPADAQALELGEQGYVRVHPIGGVDIDWVSGNAMVSLSYSTVGPDVAKAATKVEEVKALAKDVVGRL